MLATLDKFGRVIIPKKFRENLGLSKNSSINIINDENRIIIEAVKGNEPVTEKNGLLVFTGKITNDPFKEIDNDRKHRMKKLLNPE